MCKKIFETNNNFQKATEILRGDLEVTYSLKADEILIFFESITEKSIKAKPYEMPKEIIQLRAIEVGH